MSRPLILDFDGSVPPLPGADVVPLRERQEEIRFGCRLDALRALGGEIGDAQSPVVFLGSGDYHHISFLLVERLRSLNTPLQLVVFDNHPDNMRYPFGIHCGSWVGHVAKLPFVTRIHVAGITSGDVEGLHVIENNLGALRSGRVVYWCLGKNLGGLRRVGVRNCRSFDAMSSLLDAMLTAVNASADPVYLSIDKDVLAPDVIRTNWDQGTMTLDDLRGAIAALRGRVIASDVCGDVSIYRYRSRFKRLLSRLDAQPVIDESELAAMQLSHRPVNEELMSLLTRVRASTR